MTKMNNTLKQSFYLEEQNFSVTKKVGPNIRRSKNFHLVNIN